MKFITMILALLMVMKHKKRCSSSSSSCCLKLSSFLLSCLSTSCTSLPSPPPLRWCSTHICSSATMCSPSSRTLATSRLIVSMSRLSMYVPFAAASSCTSARRARAADRPPPPPPENRDADVMIGNAANAARMCTPMQAPTTAATATTAMNDTDIACLILAARLILIRAFFLPASSPPRSSPELSRTSLSLACDAASAVNGCPSAAETSARPETPTSAASLRSVRFSGL
uniref:Secreted protein n=1 Tax=Leersia perrieri TaxID=77586 RepID=A0A0D9VPK0_9ORYZ